MPRSMRLGSNPSPEPSRGERKSITELLSENREPLGDMKLTDPKLLGREFEVLDLYWVETKRYGGIPVMRIRLLDTGEELTVFTFSDVLRRQIEDAKVGEALERGVQVTGKVCKERNYYTFC